MSQVDVRTDPSAGSDLYPTEPANWSRTFLAEDPQVLERVVTAPAAGVFTLVPPEVVTAEGEIVHAGQVVGTIDRNSGSVNVVCPHTGFLMGLLAYPGERVRPEQPLVWIRVLA